MKILVRGGGDLASGVISRLHREGWQVLVVELEQPLSVRRAVSFGQAIFSGTIVINNILAQRVNSPGEIEEVLAKENVPVMVDPQATVRDFFNPDVMVDARMRKAPGEKLLDGAPFTIGLGPGFTVGVDCHAIVETKRGFHLGQVIWSGSAIADTGIPETVMGQQNERVLRAPIDGVIQPKVDIGTWCKKGEILALVDHEEVIAPFDGLIRGMIHAGIVVGKGIKIGDIDPRDNPLLCREISDKALVIGEGVLEAIRVWLARKNNL